MRGRLQPPGAGLPAFENFYLNVAFKIGTAFTSDAAALEMFQQTGQQLLELADQIDLGVASQEVLISRMQGIEDSSRNWSFLMVLDHLNRVNHSIMYTIKQLLSNRAPMDEVKIADFKPDADVGADAIEIFRETSEEYWAFVTANKPLRTSLRHRHPWFGELDGHGWHCLAAVHQRVHRRQAQKIVAEIGIA